MKILTLIVFLFLYHSFPKSFAEFPIGHWSNKNDGFDTVSLALRTDGNGFISGIGSFWGNVTKWKMVDNDVEIKIAAPPSYPTVKFKVSPIQDQAKLILPDGSSVLLYLVDASEPKDPLAHIREEAKLKHAQAVKDAELRKHELEQDGKEYKTFPSLLEEMKEIMMQRLENAVYVVSSPEWATDIYIFSDDAAVRVTFLTEEASGEDKTHIAEHRQLYEKPDIDLPITSYVPEKQLLPLVDWMESEGFQFVMIYTLMQGLWGIESYHATFNCSFRDDTHDRMQVLDQIIEGAFNKKGPFTIKTINGIQ